MRNDQNLILKVWQSLRDGMAPEAKFKLPFKKKEDHEKQLIKGISDLYTIVQTKAKVKIITKHYKDPSGEFEFNYCLEVVIAPSADRNDKPGQIKIIGCINGTPDINYGEEYFSGESGTYIWRDKHRELISSSGLKSILHHCGFDNTYETSMSKQNNHVFYLSI